MRGRKKGFKHSEESRRKIGENHNYPYGIEHPFYGKKRIEETRKKISIGVMELNVPLLKEQDIELF